MIIVREKFFFENIFVSFLWRKIDGLSQNFYINDGRSRSLYSDSYERGLDAIESATYPSELAIKPRSYQDDNWNMGSLRDILAGRTYDNGQVIIPND